MIAQEKIVQVERLLNQNQRSQRQIAKMVGISRAVVGEIAAGRRPDYEAMRIARREELHVPLGPKGACPGCGGTVHLPCVLCKVRALKTAERDAARERRCRERAAALRRLLWLLRDPQVRRTAQAWDAPCRRVG